LRLPVLASIVFTVLLAACAGDARKEESAPARPHEPLVLIQLEKQPHANDCLVAVRITNRMRDINWDAASYQVALLDGKNVTRGKLAGTPRRYTRYGQILEDSGTIYGMRCEELVGVSVIYFGYYPPGKRQTSVHLINVKAELR
jgi:hypothetical protein